MSWIGELFASLLKRPFTIGAALALASGGGLLILRAQPSAIGLEGSYKQIFVAGCGAVFLLSSAFLIVISATSGGRYVVRTATRSNREAALFRKIKKLGLEAQAMLVVMVAINKSSIWVMHTFEGAHELREFGLLDLDEFYNGACKYSIDYNTFRILQKNLRKLKHVAPDLTYAEAVKDSGDEAMEAIKNRWMSV